MKSPDLRLPVSSRSRASSTNARESLRKPSFSSRRAIVVALSPGLMTKSTCSSLELAGSVRSSPRSSRTRSWTNAIDIAPGLSEAHDRMALFKSGRSAVSRTTTTNPARTIAKIRNLRKPLRPLPRPLPLRPFRPRG
jgi:hypothetical protein